MTLLSFSLIRCLLNNQSKVIKFLITIGTCLCIIFYDCKSFSGSLSESALELCRKVANGNMISFKGTRAEFYDGKNRWTIFGAAQSETELIIKPQTWSVGNAQYQILIVKEPISDTSILPFSDPVPNSRTDDTMRISAWRGEYEPASFVIRSGDHDLSHVKVEVSDLKQRQGLGKIESENIDVRIVKCWYQACLDVWRRSTDKKRLTPELLLHDTDMVRVDYENHVNLVRDIARLQDADRLLPFNVPARTNQQVWVTVRVPADCKPGLYNGGIHLTFNAGSTERSVNIPILLDVDKRQIPESPIEYALFYLARFDPLNKGLASRGKNGKQMESELRDMRAHGLTNVAVDYEYLKTIDGIPDYRRLTPVLEAMRKAGFETTRLLFVDWRVGGFQDEGEYTRKLTELKRVAALYGFTEIYVYNKDERDSTELLSSRRTFEIAHKLGMKNFVACSGRTASAMKGLLDIAVLPRRTAVKTANSEPGINLVPWAYNDPQAGMETPATYRKVYGLSLLKDGYRGVCNYAYQSGDCWDDWADIKWRPHVMAYPTMTAPIPTVQWEGFRKAIDDVRKSKQIDSKFSGGGY